MITPNRAKHITRRSKVVTPPSVEPVTVAEAKVQMRVTTTVDDTFITGLITVARKVIEKTYGMAFINTTFLQTMDGFPDGSGPWWNGVRRGVIQDLNAFPYGFELMMRPASSVTSINVYDLDDVAALVDPAVYMFDHSDDVAPARVVLRSGQTWPPALRNINAVETTYVAGFGATAADVPGDIKQAIMQLVAWLYDHRGSCDCSEGGAAACMIPCGASLTMSSYYNLQVS